MRWSMPRIHAGRSHLLAGDVAGGEDHGGGAVGDRRAVVLAQRGDVVSARRAARSTRPVPRQLGVGVVEAPPCGCGPRPRPVCSSVALPASSSARAWRAARLIASGHSGADGVRVELAGQHHRQVARRRLAVAVDEGGVDLAELELHPRLVERPGAVHLDVALLDRRPRADAVEGHDEAEGRRRRGSRCEPEQVKPMSSLVMSTCAAHLADDRHEHLDLVAVVDPALVLASGRRR